MRRRRLTLRARLALVYGLMFVIGGGLLLALIYASIVPFPDGSIEKTLGENSGGVVTEQSRIQFENAFILEWERALNELLSQGGWSLLLVSVATIAVGWLVAGRMLRPLQRVTDAAARIAEAPAAGQGLHERIRIDGPQDELRELAETFNRMLKRLDHSFVGQRTFVSNASRELRTPLTVTRALLESAVDREGASVEIRQIGETLLEVNARHERLIEGLLLLAQSEQELTERSYVDLADVAAYVVSQTPADDVELTTDCQEAPTMGEPVLLERLVGNLVVNAIGYNRPEDGWVMVTTGTDADGRVFLEVSNAGQLVPAYQVPDLFEPFRRLGAERLANGSKGAGLGLSIVQAIADAHGGDVSAHARVEGGLTVKVTFPGAP